LVRVPASAGHTGVIQNNKLQFSREIIAAIQWLGFQTVRAPRIEDAELAVQTDTAIGCLVTSAKRTIAPSLARSRSDEMPRPGQTAGEDRCRGEAHLRPLHMCGVEALEDCGKQRPELAGIFGARLLDSRDNRAKHGLSDHGLSPGSEATTAGLDPVEIFARWRYLIAAFANGPFKNAKQ
jgi:hypothetical protein